MTDYEIHPAVDASIIAAKRKKEERRLARARFAAAERDRIAKRFRVTLRPVVWRVAICFVVLMALGVCLGLELMKASLVNFLTSAALFWLAIQLGAWLQYVLCERGYMK